MKLSDIKISKHMTLADIIYQNARKYPNKEAIVFENSRLTYRKIDETSNKVANYIIKMGIKKGDKVSMMVSNSDIFMILYFGILKAGCVVVSINTNLLLREAEFIFKNSESKILLYDERYSSLFEEVDKNFADSQIFCIGKNSNSNGIYFNKLLCDSGTERPEIDIKEEDLCCIIYTSGTTGQPKGAVFNHRQIVYNASIIGVINHRFNFFTRSLIMMPMFHSAPLNNHVLATLFVGGTIVILPKFDVRFFLETIQKEKITHFFGPSIVYLTCIKSCDITKYDLSSVQLFIMGGSPSSPKDLAKIIEKFKLKGRFMMVYGLTEGGPSGCALFPEDMGEKPSSIGIGGCIGSELVIVDSDRNLITEPQITGELAVFSECNMIEYFNDINKTNETLENGWVLTGDLAKYDEEGYIYFMDRKKDIIISGGQNVYSKEVEDVIIEHPQVQEVGVIGVFHPEWGESVKAIVSLVSGSTSTPCDIKTFCIERIAKYKRPRYVQIVKELPHNQSGKITKQFLKELYHKPEDCPL